LIHANGLLGFGDNNLAQLADAFVNTEGC
jgi:hypothetical protein